MSENDMIARTGRREMRRVTLSVGVRLTFPDGSTLTGHTADISPKGLRLGLGSVPVPVGAVCRVGLVLGVRPGAEELEIEGRVVRSDSAGLGIQFTAMGVGAFAQLRNLVLYEANRARTRAALGLGPGPGPRGADRGSPAG